MALCLGNPFEGERIKNYDIIDEDASFEMYGKDPVFVYHKTDKRNRPIRGYHTSVLKRWAYIPLYVKEAFHRTFVDGLIDRENERTTELEWCRLLTRYRDELLTCPRCGYRYIYGFSEKKPFDLCPACCSSTKTFCTLTVGKNRIVLEPGKQIFRNHLDKYSADYNAPLGTVIASAKDPSRWGIRVSTGASVEIKDSTGTVKEIVAGGVIPIVRNLKIKFNDTTIGEIK